MPKSFSEFLVNMDERQWFRMVVCFLPGLVAGKLATSAAPGTGASALAGALLVIGVSIYAFWNRIRAMSAPAVDDELDQEAAGGDGVSAVPLAARAVESSREQLAMLSELRALCGEEERESDRLIAVEVAVSPDISFAQAIRNALARRTIVGRT
jgi:hypothetical protein